MCVRIGNWGGNLHTMFKKLFGKKSLEFYDSGKTWDVNIFCLDILNVHRPSLLFFYLDFLC